jgi:transcriptional regulator with XRE-family HTH domain
MASTTTESYGEWLGREMNERGFTQRSLAKAWKPSDPETARRALRRYLKGMVPIARTRSEIAEALGADESGPSSPDDSEDD